MSWNGYLSVRRCSYIKIVISLVHAYINFKYEVYFNAERVIARVK